MRIYKVIGVMSGTSMDGIDLAYCHLHEKDNGIWGYTIEKAITMPYNETWRLRLSKLRNQNALIFHKTDRYFGEYIGQLINQFIADNNLEVDLIASHGHTIFHQPEFNLTTQIGSGASISAITGLPCVNDFRAMDVVLGGQGAPLVPIGDKLLFSEYDMCLNIGGFANISAEVEGKNVAYDICAANILLNRIAREFDQEFDKDGEIAEKGSIDYELLGALNNIDYYTEAYPKSLGREWINQNFWFHVRESQISKEDKMKTLCDHIAFQIGQNIELLAGDDAPSKKVLVTGGGAFNKTLIDHLRSHTDAEIVLPNSELIDYKEALVFALMGVLRVQNKTNVYASVTGAERDSVSGALFGDFSKLA
jgi:anhydro-N-acetylmuramic acid kinase